MVCAMSGSAHPSAKPWPVWVSSWVGVLPIKRGMAARRQRRLGEILLARGVIDEEQLRVLVAEQERTGRMLGELAVAMGLANSADVSSALSDQMEWTADAEQTSQSSAGVSLEAPTLQLLPTPVSIEARTPQTEPEATEQAPASATSYPQPTGAHSVHLILLPTPAGYQLIEQPGTAPAVGETIERPHTDGATRYLVVGNTRAPLPASRLRCARLEAI
jgi:hypothetical protein